MNLDSLLAYMPLSEDYKETFALSVRTTGFMLAALPDCDDPEGWETLLAYVPQKANVRALMRFEVIRFHQTDGAAMFRIRKTIMQAQTKYAILDVEDWDSSYVDPEKTTVNEYDVLYADSSLWYVYDAPSFERLDKGRKSLFVESPHNGLGVYNLQCYDFPGMSSHSTFISVCVNPIDGHAVVENIELAGEGSFLYSSGGISRGAGVSYIFENASGQITGGLPQNNFLRRLTGYPWESN